MMTEKVAIDDAVDLLRSIATKKVRVWKKEKNKTWYIYTITENVCFLTDNGWELTAYFRNGHFRYFDSIKDNMGRISMYGDFGHADDEEDGSCSGYAIEPQKLLSEKEEKDLMFFLIEAILSA